MALVVCDECGARYWDEDRWTICPHMPIEGPAEPFDEDTNPRGYCRRHDLFACHLPHGEEGR